MSVDQSQLSIWKISADFIVENRTCSILDDKIGRQKISQLSMSHDTTNWASFVDRMTSALLVQLMSDDYTPQRAGRESLPILTFDDRAFAAAGPGLWNSLPSHLRDADLPYSRFRRSVKTFLFG